ncbi:MAG TPA: aminoglycoside adenylyltransferase domain-containing protein [Ktedonobacterales bacterium]
MSGPDSDRRPTAHDEVNAILRALLAGVRAALGDQLVGIYLEGSLALGAFDPASSDVDFVVATRDDLPPGAVERLRVMHNTLEASGLPYAQRLEGAYIPCAALRRYDPAHARHPTIGTVWDFQIAPFDENWILKYSILHEQGIAVWGPPPAALIEPVSPDELRRAVRSQLRDVWAPRATDCAWLREREYQAFSILTLCRALHTLRHGTLASKPRAATWASAEYPQWQPPIAWALAHRADHGDARAAETAATMAFLRAALDEAKTLGS